MGEALDQLFQMLREDLMHVLSQCDAREDWIVVSKADMMPPRHFINDVANVDCELWHRVVPQTAIAS